MILVRSAYKTDFDYDIAQKLLRVVNGLIAGQEIQPLIEKNDLRSPYIFFAALASDWDLREYYIDSYPAIVEVVSEKTARQLIPAATLEILIVLDENTP